MSKSSSTWFDVDQRGLAAVFARRPRAALIAELLQNAFDEPVTEVRVTLEKSGRNKARLTVEDDSPEGFRDLAKAYVLYGGSDKADDPHRRGRFCAGEKHFLSICDHATIVSTTGTLRFDGKGRHYSKQARARGTRIEAVLELSAEERDESLELIRRMVAPRGVVLMLNGEPVPARVPFASKGSVRLLTETLGAAGWSRRYRDTEIDVYRAPAGQEGFLFELGIPVMPYGGAYDVDVRQKVPLNLERDRVPPAFLRDLMGALLGLVVGELDPEAARAAWVETALSSPLADAAAIAKVVEIRFGKHAVIADPSAPESVARAVAAGYTVIPGASFDADAWRAVKAANVVKPAGQVFPTREPFGESGDPAEDVAGRPGVDRFRATAAAIATALIGVPIDVRVLKRFNDQGCSACFGGTRMSFNFQRLGANWFERPYGAKHLDLILHELAHYYETNHLSEHYYAALSDLGARCTLLAMRQPALFKEFDPTT